MGSTKNLVLSLLAVLGLVAVLVLIVPRVSLGERAAGRRPRHGGRRQGAPGWPIEAVGLPEGWTTTSARYVRTTDGFMTWHAGYQTPSGTYVAVEQTVDPSARWVEAQTTGRRGSAPSTRRPHLATYERDTKVQNSLLDDPETSGDLTTPVTGTASLRGDGRLRDVPEARHAERALAAPGGETRRSRGGCSPR